MQFSEFITGKLKDRPVLGHVDLKLLQQSASEIQRTAISASRVCDEILMYSGQIRSSKSLSDINQVLYGLQAVLTSVIPPNVKLNFAFCKEPLRVMIDESMIQRLMVNIIKNAGEAIRNDEGQVEVTISKMAPTTTELRDYYRPDDFVPSPEYACITIEDNGEGMDSGTVDQIFTPYYSKNKSLGHGLGLAISEGIVGFHNGLIRCTSQLGQGTRFDVLLPLKTMVGEPESKSHWQDASGMPGKKKNPTPEGSWSSMTKRLSEFPFSGFFKRRGMMLKLRNPANKHSISSTEKTILTA